LFSGSEGTEGSVVSGAEGIEGSTVSGSVDGFSSVLSSSPKLKSRSKSGRRLSNGNSLYAESSSNGKLTSSPKI